MANGGGGVIGKVSPATVQNFRTFTVHFFSFLFSVSYPSKPPEKSHFDPSMAVFSEHRDHIQINIKLYETKGTFTTL